VGGVLAIAYALVQELIPVAIPRLPAIAYAALLATKFGLIVVFARLIGTLTARFLKEVRNPAADLFVRTGVASAAVYSVLLLFGIVPPSATGLERPVTEHTVLNLLGLPILWGMTIWYGRGRVKGAFCEACGVWCDEQELGVVAPAPLAQIRPQLEGGGLGALTGLEVYDIRSSGWAERIGSSYDAGYQVDWLRVTIYDCPKCRKFATLNVIEVRLARTFWSGRVKTTFGTPDSADVNRIDRLLITPEQRDRLKAHFAAARTEPVPGG
jgi:hypothetical protein